MSVFYKFKSALTYDTIQFDDLHISLQDFKKLVIQQKQFGKNTNFDLQVTNAETNEVYSEENSLIPKNSSLIVVRVPIAGSQKKPWDSGDQLGSKIGVLSSDYLQENAGNIVFKSADLAALNASENDKIQTMMMQSTIDYDTSNYLKVKGGNQYGDPPPNYVCHKCHHPGHWIKDCPITVVPDIKKSSGIPQSFMTPVDGPSVPGALMTPTGTFAVPTIDLQAYKEGKKEKPFIPSEEVEEVSKPIIPEDLTCSLCQDLLSDAVMMPCCGNSFCDDCIRNILIETEENQCPDCKEKDISPETLIPNRFLRNAVNNFRNKTGYRGGGQRVKQPEPKSEPTKSPTIETDDVEIIATIPCEDVAKVENEPETEMGSAIAVLGSGPSHRSGRIAANCAQNKLPTIHMEHRPPLGRPKPSSEGGSDNQRNLVSNGIKPPSETVIDLEKPPAQVIPHVPPPSLPDRLTGPPPNLAAPPNTSQAPPGYSQIPPLGAPPYPGGVPPLMSNFPPPPGVNPMVMPPQHMGGQPNVRMYPYSGQNMYNPQMNDRGFRSAPNRGMRMHGDQYQDRRNIVEDPLEAFERHLRERERQDKMRRNRSRRSRSRSRSRGKTRSISRSRSRSRTPLKKRSSTKTPPSMRKDSPSIKREFRSPVGANRSRSKSRSRTRMRSRSRSPIPRSGSMSPNGVGGKKKRSVSMSPGATKKRSRSGTPKKALRMNRTRSRSRSRSRSKSIARSRKRRRTRSRSRSISSRRSFSRGRSYSRSISPRSRRYYSPSHNARRVKRSRSPSRHHNSRYRSSNTNYKDGSPLVPGSYYEPNDYRGYRRGGRNQRYQRGGNRYQNSNQNYDYGNKYDRYGNNAERYDDKRYTDNNSRPYFNSNDHSSSRNRANKDTYHQAPLDNSYAQYQQHQYSEVAPPGTTDAIPSLVYNAGVTYEDPNMYNARNDKYRSPEYPVVDNTYQMPPVKPLLDEDWMKSSNKDRDHHDHYRRKSREKYHHGDADRDRERRHDSRSRYESTSPARPTSRSDEKRRSHRRGGSTSEKDKRTERAAKEGAENDRERDRAEVKTETSPDKERSRKDDHKEKKDKSKRKKKKDSDADKKKKKKVKSKKEEEAKAPEEPKIEPQPEPVVTDEPNGEKTIEFETKENDLYDDFEDTKVDRKIIENYIQIDAVPEPNGVEKRNDTVLGSVPELSKWERDDENSSDETKALTGESSYNDEQKVTTEILKRAENALFQKATKIPSKCTAVNVETKPETKEDDLILPETSREARKSGNSLQITVPVSSKSEDEGKAAPFGRISAKDRLGAKVDEKHSTVRSLVEPKKPALKSIVDVKHSSKSDTHKSEKRDDSKSKKHDDKKHDDKKHDDKKHEDRKRKESRHGDSKHSKHRDSKDSKDKKRRKSSDDEAKKKEIKEKESPEKEVPPKEPIVDTKDNEVKNNDNSNDVKSLLDKKRPSLDEASFEPDYDLTSESEEEGERKSIEDDEDKKPKIVEPAKEIKPGIDKALIQKIIDHISSSESSSDSSTDSSVERKKRKKKKSKKRKKTKKRRAYSSDTDSEESSESDSDSDAKHKRKKKHKHKNKKTRTAKKKKKSKHKS